MPSRLRLYLAISVDGFIATRDGGVDWLAPYPAEKFGFEGFMASIGTIVMGRASYEQSVGFGPWPYSAKKTIVMTSRPIPEAPKGVEGWRGDIDTLAALLRRSERDVWLFGGAKSLQAFLERGLVDRIELYVIPLLLGDGIRLFEKSAPTELRLVDAKPLDMGVVELVYERVKRS